MRRLSSKIRKTGVADDTFAPQSPINMRNRQESVTWNREGGRQRLDSITQPEMSATLLEITTIYEKVKKGRDNEIYRLSKFGIPPPADPMPPSHGGGEEETMPLVPTFNTSLAEAQAVRFLEFNKYNGLPIRKYLYFSADTSAIQSDSLESLSFKGKNYTELLKTDFYWLNITDPNESDLALLFNSFNVHDFTIADIRETNTEEKIEFYQHYTFMSTRLLREVKIKHHGHGENNSSKQSSTDSLVDDANSPAEVIVQPDIDISRQTNGKDRQSTGSSGSNGRQSETVDMDFNILLFKNYVITMHDKKWTSINDILGFLTLVCQETTLTPDWVLYSLFIELAQDAQYLLGRIEPRLNELRLGSTSNLKEMSRVLHENYEMEFQLYTIQRFLKPKVNILRTIKVKCGRRFGKILLGFLNEIREDFVDMNNDLRNLNHILERSQDTFLALVSVEKSREANEMSLVMKRISQIALIFLPIQAISGFFGMNVQVPWQDDKSVMYFWFIVGFSFIVAAIMYLSRSIILQKLNWTKAADEGKRKLCGGSQRRRRRTTSEASHEPNPTGNPQRF